MLPFFNVLSKPIQEAINEMQAKDIQALVKAEYKRIEESPEVYCSSCRRFIPVESYAHYAMYYPHSQIHCIKCGKTVMTANNIKKIYDFIKKEGK